MKRMSSYIFVGIIVVISILLLITYFYNKQTPKKNENYADYLDAPGGGMGSRGDQMEWIKFLDAKRANGNQYNAHRRWAMFNSNFKDTLDVGHDVVKTWVPNITWYYTGADKFSDLIRAARGLPPMYRSAPKINYDINDINKGYSVRAFI